MKNCAALLMIGAFTLCHGQVLPINRFPVPGTARGQIVSGPDGNLWFTEQNGKIASMSISGQVTEYTVPSASTAGFPLSGQSAYPYVIAVGPDGNIWFSELLANKIGKITTSGVMTEYNIPTPYSWVFDMVAGPDGNVWFTENSGNQIGRITPSGTITEFPLSPGCGPWGIAAGPDGNLWFAENFSSKIGKITPNGTIAEYNLPTPGSGVAFIAAGSDGNLWFTESSPGANKIGKITTTGSVTEYAVTTNLSGPFIIKAAPDGTLWFSEQYLGRLGNATTSGSIAEYPLPGGAAGAPTGLAFGTDGNLWFPDARATGINVATIPHASPANPPKTNPPASSVTITNKTLDAGQVGAMYTAHLAAQGGTEPYSWTVTGLPDGITVNSGREVLRGVPTMSGIYKVTITVTDSVSATASETCLLMIE